MKRAYYALGFNQSETGKYFEWIINSGYAMLFECIPYGNYIPRVIFIFSINEPSDECVPRKCYWRVVFSMAYHEKALPFFTMP